MSHSHAVPIVALCACLLTGPAHVPVAAQQIAVEKVNCTKGDSITKALDEHRGDRLVVEIAGMCHENVILTRDGVTLRGTNPATDGIAAIRNSEQTDAALWARGAQLFTIQNLRLTGGFAGLLATDVDVVFPRIINSRLDGNVQWSVLLEASVIEVEDSTLGPNDVFVVGAFGGSSFRCTSCTVTKGTSVIRQETMFAGTGSQILLSDTSVIGGGLNITNSSATIFDSSLQAFAASTASSIAGIGASVIQLTRTQVEGQMRFVQGANASLLGVTQTSGLSTGPTPNVADDASFVKVANASPGVPPTGPPTIASTVLGFNLSNFSNASLLQTSQVSGNLSCALGANAVCTTPANVSGTSNCNLCPKP